MCGIFGFSRSTAVTAKMAPILALFMEGRGNDSWGVTDGDRIYKSADSINKTWVDRTDWDTPTWHTRGASVGAVCWNNAHPFRFEGPRKTVVGVHNGHINNHEELKRKYNRHQCQVDSEQIFAQLAEEKPIEEIAGWGVVVWYEYPNGHPEDRKRYLSRFKNDALHIASLETGEVAFASTKGAVEAAANYAETKIKTFYNVEENKRYWFEEREGKDVLVVSDEVLNWGASPLWQGRAISYGGYSTASWLCPIKGCNNTIKDATKQLICEACFLKIKYDDLGIKPAPLPSQYVVH